MKIGRSTLCESCEQTGSIERTVMIDFKMCCLYVVLVLPGSVETQGEVVNFITLFVEYFFLFPVVHKV